MKKVGIVADNYKVDRFKKELTKGGFTDFDTSPFTADSTTIQVRVSEEKIKEVYKICQKVEMHFKRSN
jgi:nitrogen regulatory protein PII